MNALITMDPPPISASSASTTDHVGGIKKSLSDCLHRMEAKDSPMASITLGNKLNDLTKPHNTGGKFAFFEYLCRKKISLLRLKTSCVVVPSINFCQ